MMAIINSGVFDTSTNNKFDNNISTNNAKQ